MTDDSELSDGEIMFKSDSDLGTECDHGFGESSPIEIESWKTSETDEYHILQLSCFCWSCGQKYVYETKRSKK